MRREPGNEGRLGSRLVIFDILSQFGTWSAYVSLYPGLLLPRPGYNDASVVNLSFDGLTTRFLLGLVHAGIGSVFTMFLK